MGGVVQWKNLPFSIGFQMDEIFADPIFSCVTYKDTDPFTLQQVALIS